jgi:hypothetical protein
MRWKSYLVIYGGLTIASLFFACSNPPNPFYPPRDLSYSPNPARFTAGVAITQMTPDYQGKQVDQFSITPDLPEGLQIDSRTGMIYGTPTTPSAEREYTILAVNSYGSTTTTLRISVVPPAPSHLAYDSTSVVYRVGQAIAVNHASWQGGTPESITVSPALPEGLQINKTTGDLYGTPASLHAAAAYSVIAKNAGGSDTVTLTITVVATDTTPVVPVNRAPRFESGTANITIAENGKDTLILKFSDADGLAGVTLTFVNRDSIAALFAPDTGVIRWTAAGDSGVLIFSPGSHPGNYSCLFRVSDGTDSATANVVITVGTVNRPPEWVYETVRDSVSDGAVWRLRFRTLCSDPDGSDTLRFTLAGDTARSVLSGDTLFMFDGGYGDTAAHTPRLVVSDGRLTDTLKLTLYIRPEYHTITTQATHGRVTRTPDASRYRLMDTVSLLAVPDSAYDFSGWSGDTTAVTNPLRIMVRRDVSVTGNFVAYVASSEKVLNPGESINQKIQEAAASGVSKILAPKPGRYDVQTLEIEGKVTIPVNSGL